MSVLPVLIPLAITAFGLIFMGLGVRGFYQKARFQRASVRAGGVIVRIDTMTASRGGRVCFPVVRFVDARGQPHTLRSDVGTGALFNQHRAGQRVGVRYLPSDPRRFEIEGSATSMVIAGLFVVLGGGVCLGGVIAGLLFWAL